MWRASIACVNSVNIYSLAMSYAKLFASITESSLWSSSKETRLLFVSMLARANAVGFIEASTPGLARISNLTLEETKGALAELTEPDQYDKSGNVEGRRLVKMQGGWGIVNYEIYRNRRDEEERREYMREYMKTYREKGKPVNSVNSRKPMLAQAEAEAEAEAEGEREENAPAQGVKGKEEIQRDFLKSQGVKLDKDGADLLPEWTACFKGLRLSSIESIFKEAAPGIQWPSEFKAHRSQRANR